MQETEAAAGGSLLTEGLDAGEAPNPGMVEAGSVPGMEQPTPQYSGDDWRASLPVELQNEAALSKFSSQEALASSYVNLERQMGDNIPAPKTDEDWDAVYTKLGRPEEPSAYEFEQVEMPQGMEHDTAGEDYFRTTVHQAGLNDRQAKALHKSYYQLMVQRHADAVRAQEHARQEAERSLRLEQGPAYEQSIGQARAALKHYATPEFLKRLDETGMGNDPNMLKVFMRVGKDMGGETSLVGGHAQQATPADLENQISSYREEHSAALYDSSHPEHDRRVKELTAMNNQLYGNSPVIR